MIKYIKNSLMKIPSKKRQEETIIDCKKCNKPTGHYYLGNFGTPWKHEHLYACKICNEKYTSLRKINAREVQ